MEMKSLTGSMKNNGHVPGYIVETFGCQQNENDSERIKGMLSLMGFIPAQRKEDADLIIFNTCAVREHAEQRVFGKIGSLVGIKRNNPSLKIIICGCMVQQKHIEAKLSAYRYIDLIFGTRAIGRFPENLLRMYKTGTKIIDTDEKNTPVPESVVPVRDDKLKAYVTVMNGCNNFCSYCVVPYVRGREKSREPKDIKNEFEYLVSLGYRDITLLGQNVNSYGKDGGSIDFSDLLKELNSVEGDFRIRFMTSHPKDATEKLFHTVAECDKVCKHLHLPFQSGSDRILQMMNRRYSAEKYLELLEKARSIIPGVSFTSDVIVGFPTETEDDFQATLDLVRKARFNGLFTFIYSPRRNTPAAVMEGQINKEIKGDRLTRLINIQNDIAQETNQFYVGKTVTVLTEGYTDEKKDTLTGRTDTNIIVNFSGKSNSVNQFRRVHIDRALNWALFGTEEGV